MLSEEAWYDHPGVTQSGEERNTQPRRGGDAVQGDNGLAMSMIERRDGHTMVMFNLVASEFRGLQE